MYRALGLQSAQFIRAMDESVLKNEICHYHGRFLGLKEHDGWEYAFRTNASGVIVLVPVTDAGELVLVEPVFRVNRVRPRRYRVLPHKDDITMVIGKFYEPGTAPPLELGPGEDKEASETSTGKSTDDGESKTQQETEA